MEIETVNSLKGLTIKGPILLKPDVFEDERGFFYESWNQKLFNKAVGEEVKFLQDNHSSSNVGVLRGLHYQIEPKPQGKLVRCVSGSVFDVAVDIRKTSPTFGEWTGVVLDNLNKTMIWIPVGFAHGFLTLKANSEIVYKCTDYYAPNSEGSIRWSDPTINIKWPLLKKPIINARDANAPLFKKFKTPFRFGKNS